MSDSTEARDEGELIRDINGREARPGDLIRIYHYKDRRSGRKCYMHKLVVLVDSDLNLSWAGKYLYCVCVADIWKRGGLQAAHKCRLDVCGKFEIIDGLSRTNTSGLETWYERPREGTR